MPRPTHRALLATPLHFSDASAIGGAERYVSSVAHAVASASGGIWSPKITAFVDDGCDVDGNHLTRLRRDNCFAHPLDVQSAELVGAIDESDLIHINQVFTRLGEACAMIAALRGIPVIATDHGGRTSPALRTTALGELTDRILCYSDFQAGLLPPGCTIEVVRGGIDVAFFAPGDTPPSRAFALFVGRLLPHKGVEQLLQAAPSDLPIVLAGRASQPGYVAVLRSLARNRDVRIITDAGDAEIRDLYREALVTVLPSRHRDMFGDDWEAPELMGLTPLESLACGTPAIVSDAGSLPEFADAESGHFVFRNPGELTEMLHLLREDPDMVDALGRRGRARVQAEFSLDRVGVEICRIYDEVISR